jgi:4-diphosphocytidyl-2C-methyl-D-erythritol kinase
LEGAGSFRLLKNDLEEAALEEAPALRDQAGRIRAVLLREGARLAALSGSGSSYFGVFETARKAARARAALAAEGISGIVGRTLTLEQFRGVWGRARSR